MTKYLIGALLLIIFLLSFIILFPRLGLRSIKPIQSPQPVLTVPSASPTPIPSTLSTEEQIKLQEQADRDFAEQSKKINETYLWLNKLPLQSQRYYVYFDVEEKQFIAKLYPSSVSSNSVDQQIEDMKTEIKANLKELTPDYEKYTIRWDIKVEP